MDFNSRTGLLGTPLVGMIVRYPIDMDEEDGQHREFRIGRIYLINEQASFGLIQSKVYLIGESPKEQIIERPLSTLSRCRILSDTIVTLISNGKTGRLLLDCVPYWIDGSFKKYFVQIDGIIQEISEDQIIVPFHRQNPHPFLQLLQYELQNPRWKTFRDAAVICNSDLRNSTYGMEDLVGSRVMLLAHQAEVVARVLGDAKCRYILADEVGLGKTIEACVILKGLRRRIPQLKTVIIAPNSLINQWKNELDQKFWLNFPIFNSSINLPSQIQLPGCILSSEALTIDDALFTNIANQNWGLIIIDEAHHIQKNDKLFSRVKLLSEKASRSLILSATPIQRRAEEFLFLLQIMDPGIYEQITPEIFKSILTAQDKIRRRVAYLTEILNPKDFNDEEFLEELKDVTKFLKNDASYLLLVNKLETKKGSPLKKLEVARNVIAYISENYRIENRVIRNRRANLTIDMPVRKLDNSISYTPGIEEMDVITSLFDYIDKYIRKWNETGIAAEYSRLLLFACFSSPHALIKLLEIRQDTLQHGSQNNLTNKQELLRPASPRQEQSRILQVILALPKQEGEQDNIEGLLWRANKWKESLDNRLERVYSNTSLPDEKAPHRILKVVRKLLELIHETNGKVIIFSSWLESLDILSKVLIKSLSSWKIARFTSDMTVDELEQSADRFQVDNNVNILLSDELGGEGRNFQIADYIIHLDLPWTPSLIEQRIGRVDRLGRSGLVTSFIPFARNTPEEDLFNIWNEAFNLFTHSMSGMEIGLETIQEDLINALVNSVRNGLGTIKAQMIKDALDLGKAVEEERYFEQGAINQRRRDEIQQTSELYRDGKRIKDAFLGWAGMAGLHARQLNGGRIVIFDPKEFNLTSMARSNFVEVPNMQESLKRSRREHNRLIVGTFDRDVAIKEEDIVFYAPGNDPWTDSILKNSIESYRGRCCGIKRMVPEVNNSFEIFDLIFSISVDPRPLYRKGFDPCHLFRAQGYLQKPTYRIFLTKEGDVINSTHPAYEITKSLTFRPGDIHLGKRGNGQIKEFQRRYRSVEWESILETVIVAAEKKIGQEFDFMPELAEDARETFEFQVSGQRAAKDFLYGKSNKFNNYCDIDDFENSSEALVEGIAHPIFELESACFWIINGDSGNG